MPESIIKKYYEGLKANKIMGTKCKKCGAYTFPPTTACEKCGSFDIDWVEMSGRGKMLLVSHNVAPGPNPRLTPLAPWAYGHIQLEEGVFVQAIITNVAVDPEKLRDYFNKGPVDVIADIKEIGGLPYLAFKTT